MKKTVNVLRRKDVPDHYVYRWLIDLGRNRLPGNDVFVPTSVDPRTFENPKMAFFFTVRSEQWSVILVRGSPMDDAEVVARIDVLDREEADPAHIKKALQRERTRLNASIRRGLVTREELIAQAECFRDPASVRQGFGPFRAFRSNCFEVERFASMLGEAGYTVVPVLPAYSWRDVEFPVNDQRYDVPFVHAVSRAPCPWSPRTHQRQLYR